MYVDHPNAGAEVPHILSFDCELKGKKVTVDTLVSGCSRSTNFLDVVSVNWRRFPVERVNGAEQWEFLLIPHRAVHSPSAQCCCSLLTVTNCSGEGLADGLIASPVFLSCEMCEEMSVPVKDHGKNPSTPTHEEEMCEEMSVSVKDHGKNPSTPTHEEEMCEEMSVPVKDHGKNPSTPTHEEPVVEFSSFQSSDEDYVLPAIRADEELSGDDFVPESYHDEDDSDASLSFSPFTPPL
ncbi:uncharacterized protein V6R79_021177 [Siganus canaliculatus]